MPEDLQPEQALESLDSELTALLGEEDSLSSLDGELSALLEEQPEELTTLQQNNHEQLASTPELESLDNQLNSLLEESELPEDLQPEQALESLDSELTALLGEEEPLSSLDGELSALLQEQPEELTAVQQNNAEQLASTPELESLGSELNLLLEESELPEDLQPEQALESLDSELTALLGEQVEPFDSVDEELSAPVEERAEDFVTEVHKPEQGLKSLDNELTSLIDSSPLTEKLEPETADESELDKIVLDGALDKLLEEEPPEIDKLFDTSLSEITNDPDVDIFEVASVEMVEPSPRLDLLFSSLEDEISGRAVDRIEALGHIPSSDKQRLDERAANEALDTFDKDLQTLKAAKAEEEQALQDPVVRKKALREITASLKKAAAWRRIFSGLLDSIISIAAGVGIVAVTQGLEVSPLYLIPKALSYSVIFWLFSSTVMLKSAGQSIGQAFFGITTVTKLGNPLNFTSAATRSCTSLFTFMLVFIPASSIILGLPSFSDIISKTRVTTKEKFD